MDHLASNRVQKIGTNKYHCDGVEFKFAKSSSGGIMVVSSVKNSWISRLTEYCSINKPRKVSAAILFLKTILLEDQSSIEESHMERRRQLMREGIKYISSRYEIEEDRELFSLEDRVKIVVSEYMSLIKDKDFDILTQNNNPYIWIVKFTPSKNTVLSKVLRRVKETFGYDYIEFKITFTKMYPTEPPNVTFIRPRLDFTCAQYLNNLRIFSRKYWALGRGMKEVLSHTQRILDSIKEASLSTLTPELDGYTSVETKILQIPQYLTTCGYDDLDTTKLEAFSITRKQTGRGVGLTSNETMWDVTKYLKTNEEKKDTMTSILESTRTSSVGVNVDNFHTFLIESKYLLGKVRETVHEISAVEVVSSIDLISTIIRFIGALSDTIIKDYIGVETIVKLNSLGQEIKELLSQEVNTLLTDIYKRVGVVSVSKRLEYEEDEYTKVMSEYRNTMSKVSLCGKFGKGDTACGAPPTSKTRARIAMEIREFQNTAQVNSKGACFLIQNETCMCHYILIISGFKDTPYEGGLIMLGVKLPYNYPYAKPHFRLLNDIGKKTINENIYSGYICLSLTKEYGNNSERWIPNHSTLLQVAMSIQATLLSEYPYLNSKQIIEDPSGREKQMREAKNFNKEIIPNIMEVCMLDLINSNDSYGIKHIIHDHFWAMRHRLRELIKVREKDKHGVCDRLEKTLDKLESAKAGELVTFNEPKKPSKSTETYYDSDTDSD